MLFAGNNSSNSIDVLRAKKVGDILAKSKKNHITFTIQ